MKMMRSRIGFEQINECINEMVRNTEENLQYLVNICLERQELKEYGDIEGNSEIPEHILHLPIIQLKAKKYICKQANINGMGKTAKEYSVSGSLIEKWMKEREEYDDVDAQAADLRGLKRFLPDDQNLYINHEQLKNNLYVEELSLKPSVWGSKSTAGEAETRLRGDMGRMRTRKENRVFSTFCQAEKERLIHDNIKLGTSRFERKWGGIRHLHRISQAMNLFKTEEEKMLWMEKEGEIIEQRMNLLVREEVIRNIECTLKATLQLDNINSLSLSYLCTLSMERGIAVAAARNRLNIFELEFLLKTEYRIEWHTMELNAWYLVSLEKSKGIPKVDIANLALKEGIYYACKISRMSRETVRKYMNELGGSKVLSLTNGRKKRPLKQPQNTTNSQDDTLLFL